VTPYFGAKVDRWEWAIGPDPDIMINVGAKWGNKGDGVSLKIGDVGEKAEEVVLNKFFQRYPELFSTVVDNLVLVRMLVDGEGTGGGMEEVGEEVG